MNVLSLALLLAFGPPPNVPLPPEAEFCILKAELCVEQQPDPMGPDCDDNLFTCTCAEGYETCAWSSGADELFEISCRVVYVWCVLEPPNPKSPFFEQWSKECGEVFGECPTWSAWPW